MEIIEMIKKVIKNLRYTNYGKKIYDNLINNYGDYLLNNNNHNKSSWKNSKKKNQKNHININKDKKIELNDRDKKKSSENELEKIDVHTNNHKLNENKFLIELNNNKKDYFIECNKNMNKSLSKL